MARSRFLTSALASIVLLAGGCGGGSSGGSGEADAGRDVDLDAGRAQFAKTCGSCHTLADANTTGTVGPDLDGIAPDEEHVRTTIENGSGIMPPKLLEGKQAELVATYVAEVAGDSG